MKDNNDFVRENAIEEANAKVKEMIDDIDTVLTEMEKEYNAKRSYYVSIKTRLNYIWENDQIDYDKKYEMLMQLQRSIVVRCTNPKKLFAVQVMAAVEIAWKCIIWPKNIAFMLIFAVAIDYILDEKIYPVVPIIILINWAIASYMIYNKNKDRWKL